EAPLDRTRWLAGELQQIALGLLAGAATGAGPGQPGTGQPGGPQPDGAPPGPGGARAGGEDVIDADFSPG
ncbi:MAG: hypothetical protein V7603_6513, partial [Micromonosporaceae bacterium]